MGSRPSGSGSRAVNIDNREKRTPSTLTDQSSRTGIDATFGGEALAVLRRDLKYRRFSRCPNQELDEGMCWRLNALPRGYFVLAIQRESKCAGSLSYLTEGAMAAASPNEMSRRPSSSHKANRTHRRLWSRVSCPTAASCG
jgi:hypothetical protein